MAHIQKILEKKLQGMDEQTKKIYTTAELICRREYEKRFALDLGLPIGHPKNFMVASPQNLNEITDFWDSVKNKYFSKCKKPLALAVVYFCDLQIMGARRFYEEFI